MSSEYSAIPPLDVTSRAIQTDLPSAPRPGHRLFWRAWLILLPFVVPVLVLPYAQVSLANPQKNRPGEVYVQGNVYVHREFPVWMMLAIFVGIPSIVLAIGFLLGPERTPSALHAIGMLRRPDRSQKAVLAATVLVVFASWCTSFESGRSNISPWTSLNPYEGSLWYPSDGGVRPPYQKTLRWLDRATSPPQSDGPNRSEYTEMGVRRHGPWILLADISLFLLSTIGIYCCWRPIFRKQAALARALFVTAVTWVPYVLIWLFLEIVGAGGFSA